MRLWTIQGIEIYGMSDTMSRKTEKIQKSAKISVIFSEKGSRRMELSAFMRIFAIDKLEIE